MQLSPTQQTHPGGGTVGKALLTAIVAAVAVFALANVAAGQGN
jgi:hypothetical protein